MQSNSVGLASIQLIVCIIMLVDRIFIEVVMQSLSFKYNKLVILNKEVNRRRSLISQPSILLA